MCLLVSIGLIHNGSESTSVYLKKTVHVNQKYRQFSKVFKLSSKVTFPLHKDFRRLTERKQVKGILKMVKRENQHFEGLQNDHKLHEKERKEVIKSNCRKETNPVARNLAYWESLLTSQ